MDDLAKLQAGKKISGDGEDEANTATGGADGTDDTLGGDINDASIRIASLTSQLEKE